MAELETLGPKYRIALRLARDERWTRLSCSHKGIYADDCIVDRVQKHKIYIVATNDRDLKRRIRKVPGVPIMSVARGKYVVERERENFRPFTLNTQTPIVPALPYSLIPSLKFYIFLIISLIQDGKTKGIYVTSPD
ncbi:MAG: hypothetical protein Q9190_004912 [Brigantiaea leucoxantha]